METDGQAGLPAYSILCHVNEFYERPSDLDLHGRCLDAVPEHRLDGDRLLALRPAPTVVREPDGQLADERDLGPGLRLRGAALGAPDEGGVLSRLERQAAVRDVFTDVTGKKVQLKQLARASQDRWENETDGYWGEPTFGGTPVVSVPTLATVLAFPTGTAGTVGTMQTTTNNKGRFALLPHQRLVLQVGVRRRLVHASDSRRQRPAVPDP